MNAFFSFARDQISSLRDTLVSSPAFHRFVLGNPITRPVALSQTRALFDVVSGFVYAQTLFAVAELGIVARLADGPVAAETLERELALTPHALNVLMNSAAALGLVERRRAGWGLGLKGAALLGQGGVLEMVAHHKHFYADLADPVALLRGEGTTQLAAYWTYAAGAKAGSADAEGYTRLMAASQAFIADAVLHGAPFANARHILDIGGGAGAFAIAALRRHPKLRVTVADLPDVTPFADAAFRAENLSGRADTIALDMFEDPLPTEPDTITFVRILHDHDDDAVADVLARIATERPGATLVIAEPMADRRHPTGLDSYFPFYFKAMGQGSYRTREELLTLLNHAGFSQIERLPTRNPMLVRGLIARVNRN